LPILAFPATVLPDRVPDRFTAAAKQLVEEEPFVGFINTAQAQTGIVTEAIFIGEDFVGVSDRPSVVDIYSGFLAWILRTN